jgi:mercuric ion transport protein
MNTATKKTKTNLPLIGGLITALLSTVCCILPLVLLLMGIGGSWISNLTALEPYKPIFIGITFVFLVIAYWQIFMKKQDCEEGKICAVPENKRKYKIIFWIATLIVLASATNGLWAPFFY